MKTQAPTPVSGAMHEAARQLRQRQTPAEVHLWTYLRRNQLGVPFRRQHVIGRFVVDFCCPTALLIVEVDGGVHDEEDAAVQDEWRTEELNRVGFLVLRFSNAAVLQDTMSVVEQIRLALSQRL